MTETTFDRYMLGQRIGSGGMGDVYRGLDRQTNTPVAIKVLKAELATHEMVQRFIHEGEALRQLNHPNIVKLLDTVNDDSRHYLIMELVDGGALDDLLRQTPRLPIKRILNIALDMADALTRAHRLNIIHRDIKPANVLLTNDGMLRLTDFGIARFDGSNITQTGSVLGTLAYIAPEILTGAQADARSDIWSLGLMLFEMVAGEHPFRLDQHPGGLIQTVLEAQLPDLEALRPDVPPALVDLINRMVMKDPAERIPRMRLVGSELEAILTNNAETKPELKSEATELVVLVEPVRRFETSKDDVMEAVRSNLPVQTTPFVGREHELAELAAVLGDPSVRLLTIVGPGGMGKTRLALELGDKLLHDTSRKLHFEAGIFFIDLAPLTAADQVGGAVAKAVGYAFQQDGRDAKQQLLDFFREKSMLLIMDNFEHVLAGRMWVQELLLSAPSVKVLITSREKLNLNAETVFVLGGMSFPAWETPADALEYSAVKLFVQSARRARRDFVLQADDLTSVARICRMMQGMPLGIVLAASWLETLTPREIVDEIGHSLDFLETEKQDLPERQRSLRAVFEYSWSLLTEQEQMLFARFSLFRGGFTRDAAAQIVGTNLRALTVLVNKSLLRRDNVSGRYEVHELLRQYAEEKLNRSADAEAACEAFSRYYLDMMAQLTPKLKGFGQLDALALLDADFDNIRAAWNQALKARSAAQIEAAIEGLYLYLTFRNRLMDGEQMFAAARAAWRAEDANLSLLGGKLLVRFPQEPPLAQYKRGLAIAELFGDAAETAFCQRLVGHWLSHTEFNHQEGIPVMQASLRGYRALGDKFYAAQVLDDLGWSFKLTTELEREEPTIRESLDLRREIGDKIGEGNSLRNLGGTFPAFLDGSDRAITHWEAAKKIAHEGKDRVNVAWTASLIACNLIFKAEYERAEQYLQEAYPLAADLNHRVVKSYITLQRGMIVLLRDNDVASVKGLATERLPPELMDGFFLFYFTFLTSLVACALGDTEMLRRAANTIFKKAPGIINGLLAPILLAARIIQFAERGESDHAAELLHAYWHTTPTFEGRPIAMAWAQHWVLLQDLRAQLETKLGSEAYAAAVKRGEALPESELKREARTFLDELLR